MIKFITSMFLYFLLLNNAWSMGTYPWASYEIAFPIQETSENKVIIVFTGKNFSGRGELMSLNAKRNKNLEKEERFILNVITNNAGTDRDKVLALWVESEREKIRESMKTADNFERNSAFFRNIESTKLVSVIKYRNFFLFFVKHEVKGLGEYMKLYPVVMSTGNYFMSNSLNGDLFYEKIANDLLPLMENIKPVK